MLSIAVARRAAGAIEGTRAATEQTMREPETLPIAFPEATLRPLVGTTELAVAEAAAGGGTRPERVTRVLSVIYATVADQPSTPVLMRTLCTGGREWLLQQAAHRLRPGLGWFESRCEVCAEPYDLSLSLGSAARSESGNGFPVAEVRTSLGTRCFEVPSGRHEEAWARPHGEPGRDPRRFFAAVCGLADDSAAEVERFDGDDLERIDRALEELSPDVADSVVTTCPACGERTSARLEPLAFGFPDALQILRDVHLIAGRYSWSEDQILELPARRRSAYAALIGQPRPAAAGRMH